MWSLIAFMFGIGFVSRIDPSILHILTVSDLFGLSLSYAIYLIPIAAIMTLWPWQFMLPWPSGSDDKDKLSVEFFPFFAARRIYKNYGAIFIFSMILVPNIALFLDNWKHWIDRSSLFYVMKDTVVLALTMFGGVLIATNGYAANSINKVLISYLFIGSFSISGAYLCGDYMASIRLNSHSGLDCAILENGTGKCTPILVWGSSHFITWQGDKIRAIPSEKLSHIWLHPAKRPDPRREP